MNVKELKEALSKFPDETRDAVDLIEGDFDIVAIDLGGKGEEKIVWLTVDVSEA